ncbi:GNAT family N-acetyltransferase [Spongiactinospora gelatinilytica]|uniref:GNAT family N-acetyltransferase n=1 Tax=Spongiactinospora gelatinilytica TaxID=2666298 RepID=A0A2W2GV29_9ACTN|nr:GNAT family N-acetyltransferase [Spongiactinospora gelatinilytica]PZG51533.1 GNAT family N-acetyltransferase [Spongiactinospora gelatinilytica]
MPLPLSTERLILRAPEPADLGFFVDLFADREAVRYIADGEPWSAERIRGQQKRKIDCLAERGFTLYTVVRAADGQVVGDCGLAPWENGRVEIGWRFARPYWGQGLAKEAARAVFEHAGHDLGLTELWCLVQEPNTASWRIAEGLGFRLDRTEIRHGGRTVRIYNWNAGPERPDAAGQARRS